MHKIYDACAAPPTQSSIHLTKKLSGLLVVRLNRYIGLMCSVDSGLMDSRIHGLMASQTHGLAPEIFTFWMHQTGKTTWLTKVKELFDKAGMSFAFTPQGCGRRIIE